MLFILFVIAILLALAHRYVRGENLTRWDTPRAATLHDSSPSEIHQQFVAKLKVRDPKARGLSATDLLSYIRKVYDDTGTQVPIEAPIVNVKNAPLGGEWIAAEGSVNSKRMLYLHGGAFKLGSPRSHRPIAQAMSKALGGPVFVPDYRLTPENHRNDCVTDARSAYLWLWKNTPVGPSPAKQVFVAGDSAGGNLALGLLPWIRDNELARPAAAIALSPALDQTISAASYKGNLDHDTLLKPMLSAIRKVPNWLLPWAGLMDAKARPSAKHISPLFASLHDLPPTLIQASTAECLEDDSRRWANKAQAAGSPVTLQLWSKRLHVWQSLISHHAPEAVTAFEHITAFIDGIQPGDHSEQ